MSERIVPITGMTCAACERTVVTAARQLDGVTVAHADRRSGRLRLTGDRLPSDAALAAALADTPYGVGSRRWLSRDRSVWRDVTVAAVLVGVAAIVLWVIGFDGLVQQLTVSASPSSALVVLGLGVAASVSTCMALVGGLVVSLSASVPSNATGMARLRPHLAFNAGRIVGFAALGALVGLVGQVLAPTGLTLAAMTLLAAVVMVIIGVRLTGVSPRIAAWQVTLPRRWGAWASAGNRDGAGMARAAGLGAATFFLPCGFTQAVQVYALATGSALDGALVMGLFAIGTAPGLLAAGGVASTAGARSGTALRAVGVVVLAFAFVTGSGAVTQMGPMLRATNIEATERTGDVADVDGVQLATTVIAREGYVPATTVVYVDEPVRWTLEPEVRGCQSVIDASALGLPLIDALLDSATVEFTLTEPGTYRYSCTMGMYFGAIVAIERPSDTSGEAPAAESG